jgi:presenilin-like A22 family membrane protease
MVKKTSHISYYIFLLVILFFGFILASLSANRQMQIAIIVLTTIFYVIWGIFHHLINHDLTAKIVIEYILIGSLGLTVILFLLKGGLGI